MPGSGQLSLNVGGGGTPDLSTFKVSGKLDSETVELRRKARVHVTITDASGEVVAQGPGTVGVGFKDHEATATRAEYLERVHTIKLD